MTLAEKIWNCESSITVETIDGKRFVIHVKRYAGLHGFRYPGSKRKYFILSRERVEDWAQGLREVVDNG